ncbi:hypothetical protein PPL_06968 [Heterostelium album PN500]|uniref:Uncharacterized protein n=1 Tax=Heterostelium pallidum (strain ATCC 26659 / Pp 5 / PN500) TaxID=670386 RepID=D3BE15_HETP5|nr:hypothetical protein PPL_06968 [Heterostelium album PN500]EFA80146.1 hypothetical protein PPL_06968 [Heterostelium album PN500]|eukprot:XP_020432266.1 hypothetical protein PPL_06968 [Heterostelium album PN500]
MKKFQYNIILLVMGLVVVSSSSNYFVEGSDWFIHQYLPGLQMVSPDDSSVIRYLAFPELLFDFNSPILGSHMLCTNNRPSHHLLDLSFSPGNVHKYLFDCNITNPFLLSRFFLNDLHLRLDWKTRDECQCLFPKTNDTDLITGIILTVSVTPLGFANVYYSIDSCTAEYVFGEKAPVEGDTFTQLIVLDGGPLFMTGTVYLFIGMAVFCILVASCIIGILRSIYYHSAKSEHLSIELTSMSLELVTELNEEERQKDFLAKIDDLLK